MKANMQNHVAVLVTTSHRGVFFGYLSPEEDKTAASLTLADCRNAIYWAGKNGFLGLASYGPDKGSRIGTRAPSVLLHGVTSVADCTDIAVKKWESYDA